MNLTLLVQMMMKGSKAQNLQMEHPIPCFLLVAQLVLVAIIAVIASLILLRNRRDEIDEKQFVRQEELFETVAITTTTPAAPSRPPVTTRGEMYDGYEGIEFPVGSGKWFYRDPESGAWVEWR